MKTSVLINIAQFQQLLQNPKAVILDTTIDKVNQKIDNSKVKLIPNSLFFDIENDFSAADSGLPHTMIDADTFTKKVQQLGINQDSIILLYDRWGVYSSPRAWWMFTYMGHKNVFILNGGMPEWEVQNLPFVTAHMKPTTVGDFQAKPISKWFVDKEYVLAHLESPTTKVIDARGTGRFEGKVAEPRPGVRSGHIPESANLPFENVLSANFMLEPAELINIFDPYLSTKDSAIFSCGSGITACILALAATEAGHTNNAVYDGSWAEWGSDTALPIAR